MSDRTTHGKGDDALGAAGAEVVGLVIVAAGSGERLGSGVPKGLVRVAGRTLLAHCIHNLAGIVDVVVVVGPPDHLADVEEDVETLRDLGSGGGTDIAVVAGGASRMDSVAAGLAALPAAVTIVAVHDAARPLVNAGTLTDAVRTVAAGADAAAPAVAVTDTIKSVCEGSDRVAETLPRAALRAVQTPQVFRRDVLAAAHRRVCEAAPSSAVTDDLSMVEGSGGDVRLVPGSRRYLKVTHPEDLILVEAMAADPSLGRDQDPTLAVAT